MKILHEAAKVKSQGIEKQYFSLSFCNCRQQNNQSTTQQNKTKNGNLLMPPTWKFWGASGLGSTISRGSTELIRTCSFSIQLSAELCSFLLSWGGSQALQLQVDTVLTAQESKWVSHVLSR